MAIHLYIFWFLMVVFWGITILGYDNLGLFGFVSSSVMLGLYLKYHIPKPTKREGAA